MKKHIKTVAILALILLFSTLVGQIMWLINTMVIKKNEFIEITSLALYQCVDDYLEAEMINRANEFSCGLEKDGKTLTYGNGESIQVGNLNEFMNTYKKLFYDHNYDRDQLNIEAIKSLYIKQLREIGVWEVPILKIQDKTDRCLLRTDPTVSHKEEMMTKFVEVGYENPHHCVAIFREPILGASLNWQLSCISIFFIGFCITLWWLWHIVKTDLKMANVQTMGIAHIEHELKKPLMMLLAATKKMYTNSQEDSNAENKKYIETIHGRLTKFQNIIDTMLYAVKTDHLEISRQTIDLRKEIELAVEVYKELKVEVLINYHIAKGCEQAVLDEVYWGRLVFNLIDNGIKYNKNHPPKIDIDFRQENNNSILTVSDNGIGIPKKQAKKIFKRFYRIEDRSTVKRTGFGLGLTFVKQVVDAYNGSINVESNETGGTTFIIKLPTT